MTKQQEIYNYLCNMSYTDLIDLVEYINSETNALNGLFLERMEDFNFILSGYTPLEIATMTNGNDFDVNDDFFYIDYNNLCHSYDKAAYVCNIWQEIDKVVDVLANWDDYVYVENHMHVPFKFDTSMDKIVNKRGENL